VRALAVNVRHCCVRVDSRVERTACRSAREGSLDAMVWLVSAQWVQRGRYGVAVDVVLDISW